MFKNKDKARYIWVVCCNNDEIKLTDRMVYSCLLYLDKEDFATNYKKVAQLTGLDWQTVQSSIDRLRGLNLLNGLRPSTLDQEQRSWFFTKSSSYPDQHLSDQLAAWKMYVRPAKGYLSRDAVAILSFIMHVQESKFKKPRYGYSYSYLARCLGINRSTIQRISNKYDWLWIIDQNLSINYEKINADWFAKKFDYTEQHKPTQYTEQPAQLTEQHKPTQYTEQPAAQQTPTLYTEQPAQLTEPERPRPKLIFQPKNPRFNIYKNILKQKGLYRQFLLQDGQHDLLTIDTEPTQINTLCDKLEKELDIRYEYDWRTNEQQQPENDIHYQDTCILQ